MASTPRTVRPVLFVLLALAAFAALSLPAWATSYVMVSDENLARQAELIAEVTVVSVERSPVDTAPSTDYMVNIEHLIKGFSSGSSIVVRVPGGVRADGLGVRIWGAPEFIPGSKALLFLQSRTDGTYAILHLMLGAFHSFDTVQGGRVAMRNLSDATEFRLLPGGGSALAEGRDRPRDYQRFVSWLEDQVNGNSRPADYFVELREQDLKQVQEKFTLFVDSNLHPRWFEFDTGGSVPFFANQSGQPGLAGGGFTEFQIALAAWDNNPGTHIHYVYAGTTAADGGLTTFDNVNAILFGDPHGEITSPFSCTSGGILAHGGPWFDPTVTGRFNGQVFIRTQGGDITTNKGIDCFFQHSANPSKAAQELFGHELGHTLGLGHSCGDDKSPSCASDPVKDDALMRTYIHDDGRGARINPDDNAGISFLYKSSSAQGRPCVANPQTLCLQNRRFAVQVSWTNQFDNSSGVGRAVPSTDTTGFFSFGDPSNLELMVKVLNFGTVEKVFYGELTNLQFTITITDTRTGQVNNYSNTTGDCGGIDQTAFASSTAASTQGVLKMLSAGAPASGSCRADKNTLCLLNGRFAITVDWSNPGNGASGHGGARPLSGLVGTFFFTDPTNVELMTKMLDFGDRIAFFYGALSDLPYTIHVTDTTSGTVKTYQSTAGVLCGGLDNNAF